MNEKELNASKLIADILLAIPQVMKCMQNEDNRALAATLRAIIDDLTSDPNPTKLGDGAILAMLMKLLPYILQILPLFLEPKK